MLCPCRHYSLKNVISENLRELQTEARNIVFLCSLKRKISYAHFQSGKNLAVTLEHLSLTKHSETFLSKQSQLVQTKVDLQQKAKANKMLLISCYC